MHGEISAIGRRVHFPLCRQMNTTKRCRPQSSLDLSGPAVIVILFHCAYSHAHESSLRAAAFGMEIIFERTIQPGTHCSIAKRLQIPIFSATGTYGKTKLGRTFVDQEPKCAHVVERKEVYDDVSRGIPVVYLGLRPAAEERCSPGLAELSCPYQK